MTSESQTEYTDTRPCPFKKRAGHRPALQIQAEHQMTSESQTVTNTSRAPDDKRVLDRAHRHPTHCSFKEKAGRRPALQIQAKHQLTSVSHTAYTDTRHMAH
jgi:hypothetical protein